MGFFIVTGRMGDGKSYLGAEVMRDSLAEGAIVHTNLAINPEAFIRQGYDSDHIVQLGEDISKWNGMLRPGIEGRENVIIVDEGAILFNARDFTKAKDEKTQVFQFMVMSRKLGFEVYFISQHEKNIDAQLRRMAQGVIRCVKTARIKPLGFVFSALCGDFRRHWMDCDGRTIQESKWARFNADVAALYRTDDTHGKFDGIERHVTRQAKADHSKASVLRKGWVMLGIAAGCVTLTVSIARGMMARFDGSKGAEPEALPLTAAPVAPPPRLETPPLALPQAKPVQESQKDPRFIPRFGQGRTFRGEKYVDLDSGMVLIGGIFRDAVVVAISDRGQIVEIHLDDGRKVATRPATREDSRATVFPPEPQNVTKKWKKSHSSGLPFLEPSSSASVPGYPSTR